MLCVPGASMARGQIALLVLRLQGRRLFCMLQARMHACELVCRVAKVHQSKAAEWGEGRRHATHAIAVGWRGMVRRQAWPGREGEEWGERRDEDTAGTVFYATLRRECVCQCALMGGCWITRSTPPPSPPSQPPSPSLHRIVPSQPLPPARRRRLGGRGHTSPPSACLAPSRLLVVICWPARAVSPCIPETMLRYLALSLPPKPPSLAWASLHNTRTHAPHAHAHETVVCG